MLFRLTISLFLSGCTCAMFILNFGGRNQTHHHFTFSWKIHSILNLQADRSIRGIFIATYFSSLNDCIVSVKVLDSNAAVDMLLLGPPLKSQEKEHTETKKGSLVVGFAEFTCNLNTVLTCCCLLLLGCFCQHLLDDSVPRGVAGELESLLHVCHQLNLDQFWTSLWFALWHIQQPL